MIIPGLSTLTGRYDGYILDLWGVLHDGERPYPGALDCLERLRAAGKRICLLSNAPRRIGSVARLLAEMGISSAHYHHLMTSGEATYEALSRPSDPWHARLGTTCLHLGPERDREVFSDLPRIDRVDDPERAAFILNTGPSTYDDTPLDYGPVLEACVRRSLPMVCANPDIEVMIGTRVVTCAGAVAQRYRELGGEVRYHGKPHASVYQRCFDLLGIADRRRIVALGDTLHTDVSGAIGAGIDAVLVSGGILCSRLGSRWGEPPDPGRLAEVLAGAEASPIAVLPRLAW
ncbi:MAG: TIGR01459 family HAD-type hydrolase [Rhodospirillaceae bacterium]